LHIPLPSFLYNVYKTRNPRPEVFKAKIIPEPWPNPLTKEDRVVIRERRGQCYQHIFREQQLPFFVAKNYVQSDQGGFFTFIAPWKFPILEAKFKQLTAVYHLLDRSY
jgi:hypothetical protein